MWRAAGQPASLPPRILTSRGDVVLSASSPAGPDTHSPVAAAPAKVIRLPDALPLWHLLSFDAPTVACVWMWFVARSFDLQVGPAELVAMFLAVWVIYAVDRLLDASSAALVRSSQPAHLQPRHQFHQRYQRWLIPLLILAVAPLAFCLTQFRRGEIRLDLILAAALAGWFAIIHVGARSKAVPMPKEFVLGVFFAAAVFVPAFAQRPELHSAMVVPALLFGLLCTSNGLFIHRWENPPARATTGPPHEDALTRLLLSSLKPLAFAGCVLGVAAAAFVRGAATPIGCAVALSLAALLVLDRYQQAFAATDLRALADLVLLSPLLLTAWLH